MASSGTNVNSRGSPASVVECSSFEDFARRVRVSDSRTGVDRWFRGQRDISWGLVSSLHRTIQAPLGEGAERDIEQRREMKETEVLASFKSGCAGLPGFEHCRGWDEREWWARGQHYGLLTPYLDWTASPFVAAFFALIDVMEHANPGFHRRMQKGWMVPEGKVAVWEYCRSHAGLDVEAIGTPLGVSARQKAQAGAFTRVRRGRATDLVEIVREQDQGSLRVFHLPAKSTVADLAQLQLMNISYLTLFPDVEGAARHVNIESIVRIVGEFEVWLGIEALKDLRI